MSGMPKRFFFVAPVDLGGRGARPALKDPIDIAGFSTRMGSACLAEAITLPLIAAGQC
jgi:hypothetical protein